MAIFLGIVAFVMFLVTVAGAVFTFLETAYFASAMFALVGLLFFTLACKMFVSTVFVSLANKSIH